MTPRELFARTLRRFRKQQPKRVTLTNPQRLVWQTWADDFFGGKRGR